jgi:Ca2+-binding RTX toxin-like protein
LDADNLSGGSGDDTYVVDNPGDFVSELPDSGVDTVWSSVSYSLPANIENLILTGTANLYATGNDLNNNVTGNSGNNTLNGGTGADNLGGGSGDDTYVVDNPGDFVSELPDSGVDTVWSSVSYSLTANIENLILTGTANLYAIGNDLNNNVTGNSGNNTLNGGAGSDNLSGGSGDDTYIVDNAGDIVYELPNSGIDTVRSFINYTLPADIENLTLLGMANLNGTGNGLNNNIVGNSGNNTLVGGNGNDTLNGEAGDDLILTSSMTTSGVASSLANGGPGNDSIVANGQDTALGGDGNDLLYSSTGDWVYFDGGNGNDTLIGNRGVNILAGGADTDVLIGGLGNDYFYGGPGLDYFNLSTDIAPGAIDSIGDWSTGGISDAILLPRAFSGSTTFYQYGAGVIFLVPQGGDYYYGYVPNAMVADVKSHTYFV